MNAVAAAQLDGIVVAPQADRVDSDSIRPITVSKSSVIPRRPGSALTTTDTGSTVRVLGDDGVESVQVTVGSIGGAMGEITEGVSAGDEVVLAELDAEINAAGEINTSSSFP